LDLQPSQSTGEEVHSGEGHLRSNDPVLSTSMLSLYKQELKLTNCNNADYCEYSFAQKKKNTMT